jgi:phage major head subunit gpT-like protein
MGAKGLGSRAIIGEFYARLEQNVGAEWVPKLSPPIPFHSDQASEEYKWLGMTPAMREWIGGRLAKGFRENGITVVNKKFEATLEVLGDEIRRDKTGQVMTRVREMADRANAHWASLLSTLILNGATGVCYDGDYFYGDAHAEGDSGTQDNNISIDISELPGVEHGTITVPSAEEMQVCIFQAIATIVSFKDDKAEPMNENAKEFLVMVAPALFPAAAAACKDFNFTTGLPNVITAAGFKIQPVANARLTTFTSSFPVFRADGEVKPFIRQQEIPENPNVPVIVGAVAEGTELEFNEDKHHYGIWASRNVAYGYWQHVCFVTMI